MKLSFSKSNSKALPFCQKNGLSLLMGLGLVGLNLLGLVGCGGSDQITSGTMEIRVGSENAYLIKATGVTCKDIAKGTAASAASPHFKIPSVKYSYTGDRSVSISYIEVTLTGGGLSSPKQVITIAGEDLSYLMCGNADCSGSNALSISPPYAEFQSQTSCGLVVGGVSLTNLELAATLRGRVKIFGIESDTDGNSVPITAEDEFTLEYRP